MNNMIVGRNAFFKSKSFSSKYIMYYNIGSTVKLLNHLQVLSGNDSTMVRLYTFRYKNSPIHNDTSYNRLVFGGGGD